MSGQRCQMKHPTSAHLQHFAADAHRVLFSQWVHPSIPCSVPCGREAGLFLRCPVPCEDRPLLRAATPAPFARVSRRCLVCSAPTPTPWTLRQDLLPRLAFGSPRTLAVAAIDGPPLTWRTASSWYARVHWARTCRSDSSWLLGRFLIKVQNSIFRRQGAGRTQRRPHPLLPFWGFT